MKKALPKANREPLTPPIVNVKDPIPKEAFMAKEKLKDSLTMEIEKVANLSIKERYDIFMNETSFTALAKIHNASSVIKKIIWIVLVLGMVSWLTLQCYWLISKYFSYPVEVKIELKSTPSLDFPSVTVCNRNPLKQSQLATSEFRTLTQDLQLTADSTLYDKSFEMMRDKNENTTMTNSTMNGTVDWDDYMMDNGFSQWDALDDGDDLASSFYKKADQECVAAMVYAAAATNVDEDEIMQYGHQKKDLIMSCKVNGALCSPANFTYMHHTKYGNCYTFNSFKDPNPALVTTFAGPQMALVVEFNIEQDDYIPSLAADAGVRVSIHDRGMQPFPEDDGFSIAPGFLTSVGLRKTELTRLPPPHATCANKPNRVDWYMEKYGVLYNKRTCMKSCTQDVLIRTCNCAVAFYVFPANATVCDPTNETVVACLKTALTNLGECDSQCPDPCKENVYETSISMSSWPSKSYEHYLNSRIQMASSDFMEESKRQDSSSNLAKLEIYFVDMSYQIIEQQKAYESQNLISDIGGQLGLWLGLSAITIGELVEFFGAVFKAVTAKAVRRRQTGTTMTPVEPYN